MRSAPYQSTYLLTGAKNSKEVVKYPNEFSVEDDFKRIDTHVSNENVEATFEEYLFEGVRIEIRNIKLEKELCIDVNHNFPFFKMHFEIEGYSSYIPRNEKSLPVIIPNGHHQLFFFPAVDGKLTYPAKTTRSTLEVNLTLEFVHKVFKNNWTVLEKLGDAILKNKPLVFSPNSHQINSEIQTVIQQIIHCKIDKEFKKAYLEAKVIELLVLQLQDLKNDSKSYIHNFNEHKIMNAKNYIDKNIDSHLTITSISKNVGMNTQDFKKDFKNKYGKTVFKFITSKRMELSMDLLKKSDKSISDIANAVGYKYSQHFTKAFKNHYGVNPSFYRNKKEIVNNTKN